MDVKKALQEQIKASITYQEKKVKDTEIQLQVAKSDLEKMKQQLTCDHEFTTDYAIMGGKDIDTCKHCGVQWIY